MYTLYISITVIVIILVYGSYDGNNPWFWSLILGFATSLLGIMLGLLVGLMVTLILPADSYTKTYSYNLDKIPGTDKEYLGYSNITDDKYVVYIQDKMLFIPKKDITIKVDTSKKPMVFVTTIMATTSIINEFASDSDVGMKKYVVIIPKKGFLNIEANIK